MCRGVEVKAKMVCLLSTGGADIGNDGGFTRLSLEVEARVAKVHIEELAFLVSGNANGGKSDMEQGL